jgi:hypothetical protein
MPVTFTLPPDTRAVGQGNPPADVNAHTDAFNASGAVYNVLNTAYAGGADPAGVADSTAAFQAAITAATGTASQPAQEVIIPPGTYNLNTGNIDLGGGPVKIRGLGSGTDVGVRPNSTARSGVILNCNGNGGSTNMFRWSAQSGGLEMSNLQISYTGGGDIFGSVNFNGGVFRDMTAILTAAGSRYMSCTGNNLCINMTHERCYITTTNAVRTQPMVSLASNISAGVSESTWFRCGFTNSGQDNTQYMVFYSCTAPSGNGYHVGDNFIDCFFEHPFGGCFQSLSGSCCKVDGCTVWDLQPSFGQSMGNSLFYFGAQAGNNGSQGVQVLNTTRNQNATNLDGTHTWDVYCESTTSQVRIDSYTVLPAGAAVQTNAWFNLNGCNDAVITNCTAPRGSGINGNSTTVITGPAAAQVTANNGILTGSYASNQWRPQDSGWLAWSFDPAPCQMTAAAVQTSGVMLIINVMLRDSAATISGIDLFVATNGATLTTGQNLVGLYNQAGTQLGFSADQTTAWGSGAPHDINATLTAFSAGSLTLVPTGMLRIAILAVGTTPPAFGRGSNLSNRLINGPNQTGTTCRWGTLGSGLTALPTSITPSSITVAQQSIWAAVN